jgi:hypothetical protein
MEKIQIRDGKKSDPESGKTSRIRNNGYFVFLLKKILCLKIRFVHIVEQIQLWGSLIRKSDVTF